MLIYDQNHDSLFYLEKTAVLEANKKIFDTVVGENNITYSFGINTVEGVIKVDGQLVAL